MRPFLLACFVALAAARPEPPVGYAYQAPSGGHSHGGGSLSGGALGGGIQYASNGGYSYLSGGHGGASNGGGLSLGGHGGGNLDYSYSSGGHGGVSNGGGLSLGGNGGGLSLGGHGGGLSFGGDNGGFGGLPSGGLGGGHGVSSGFDSSSSFTGGLHGNGGGFGGGQSYAPQAPTVHKHVYVHVAPEEQEERRAPQHIPVAAPQKHYKIIFIKAPAPATPTAPVIPVQPQNEEKTLVYVLVKKPEDQPELVLPSAAPTQPSKPEVYFIRYKTQKEQSHGGALGGANLQGPSGPSGIEATAPGSGLDGLSHGPSSFAGGPSDGGAGHPSVGGDLSSAGPSYSNGGSSGGLSYIPPSSGHSSAGSSSKYGPPGYHK